VSWMNRFRSTVPGGGEVVPPTLLITLDHPWLGAATLTVVLGAWVLQLRLVTRSAQARQQALLAYAQGVSSLGGDPTAVIKALQSPGSRSDLPSEPSPSPRGDPESGVPIWLYRPPDA
jgi:hypothetical protein